MLNSRIPLLSLALTLLGLACQGTESDSLAFSDEGWTVSSEPVVVIGGADEREGYVLGVSKDEFDVQAVQLHRLVR